MRRNWLRFSIKRPTLLAWTKAKCLGSGNANLDPFRVPLNQVKSGNQSERPLTKGRMLRKVDMLNNVKLEMTRQLRVHAKLPWDIDLTILPLVSSFVLSPLTNKLAQISNELVPRGTQERTLDGPLSTQGNQASLWIMIFPRGGLGPRERVPRFPKLHANDGIAGNAPPIHTQEDVRLCRQ